MTKKILTRVFLAAILLFCVLITIFLIYLFVRPNQPDPFDFLCSEWTSKDGSMTIKVSDVLGFTNMADLNEYIDSLSKDEILDELDELDDEWHNRATLIRRTDGGKEEQWRVHRLSYNNVYCENSERWWHIVWCTEKYVIFDVPDSGYIRFNRVS